MKLKVSLITLALVAAATIASHALCAPITPAAHDEEPSQITVTSLGGVSRRINFSADDTVAQLKAKISQANGAPTGTLELVYAGKQLKDDQVLGDYGIQRDSNVISLQRPASAAGGTNKKAEPIERVTIKTIMGEMVEVPADRDFSVGQFKRVVELYIRGVDAGRLQLIFNGIILDDDEKTLAECGLLNHSTVTLTISTSSGHGTSGHTGRPRIVRVTQEELINSLVDQLNHGKSVTRMTFEHDAHYANLELVQALITDRVKREIDSKGKSMAPLLYQVYGSDNLRVEFNYVYHGQRFTTVASLSDGADWVAAQAQGLLDQGARGGAQEQGGCTASTTTIAP